MLRNCQKALKDILDISFAEQETIIRDIVTMIIEKKEPVQFYDENYNCSSEQIIAIPMILYSMPYTHPSEIDVKIEKINRLCPDDKKFFPQWLKARSTVFNKLDALNNDISMQEKIVEDYKNAFATGSSYAGAYTKQFLLEAIILNLYFFPRREKDIDDYHSYGYALEIFPKKQELLECLKQDIGKMDLKQQLIFVHQHYRP
ncbi:hypothetical protein FACS189476_12090 [Spirochaetia bacterium]|nr:hypothetical protein FACS189476_12090 [Spirochaetia bacterium]